MSYSIPASAYNRNRASEATLRAQGLDEAEAKDLENQQLEREYGGGMSRAELQDFETLIGRLEGSKMRQSAQGNRARQRDTFAAGLAGMMGNF
jgi:hypothetical protein